MRGRWIIGSSFLFGLACGGLGDPGAPDVAAPDAAPGAEAVGIAGADGAQVFDVAGAKCYVYAEYTVRVAERTDDVGQVIRVARRDGAAPDAPCEAPDYLAIHEPARYFFGLSGGALFLDEGTGPARQLLVYDLPSRSIRYQGTYGEPIALTGGRLTFYEEIPAPAGAPCPEGAAWQEQGLGFAFEERVSLDVRSGALDRSGEIRCSARQ